MPKSRDAVFFGGDPGSSVTKETGTHCVTLLQNFTTNTAPTFYSSADRLLLHIKFGY